MKSHTKNNRNNERTPTNNQTSQIKYHHFSRRTMQKASGNNSSIGNYNNINNNASINAQASRPPVLNNSSRPNYQPTTSSNQNTTRVSQDVRTCYRCAGSDHLIAKCQQQVSSTTDAAQLTTIPIRHV